MYMTPKPLRQFIGMLAGRRPHDFMVRIWAGTIFYGIIGFAIGYALPFVM